MRYGFVARIVSVGNQKRKQIGKQQQGTERVAHDGVDGDTTTDSEMPSRRDPSGGGRARMLYPVRLVDSSSNREGDDDDDVAGKVQWRGGDEEVKDI